MKRNRWRYLLLLFLLLALAGCDGGAVSGTVIWEGARIYGPGDVVAGEMVVLDGEVTVQQEAEVTGSVYMLGGTVEIAGSVGGDVALIAGDLGLGPTAVVGGDLSIGGGDVEQSPQATVRGDVLGGSDVNVSLETLFPQPTARQRLLRLLPQALIIAVLAYLVARFLGRPLAHVRRATVDHPIVSGAMGLLVGIVAPSLLVLMAFTVILVPITLIALLLAGLVVVYAWIGLGAALGRWLRRVLRRDWSPPVSAFAGTLLFMVITNLLVFIPLVGGWIGILATAVGIGAVFLTRFGLREFTLSYDFGPPHESPAN
ncbi:MAG: hypothetical protein R3248_14045 [Candidatus Promineifilaceae bacterium]|nr:hypothetical protein [Candidatus Promineifilaceae bacterium]